MHRVALVFVYFPHDDVLDVGKRVSLVQVREVFERQVLMEILHDDLTHTCTVQILLTIVYSALIRHTQVLELAG